MSHTSHTAASVGDAEAVRRFRATDPTLATQPGGERGWDALTCRVAPVDVRVGKGCTPLMLAVRACIDSYWNDRRSPDSVATLLAAGARVEGIELPAGYSSIDELLLGRG